MRDALVNKQSQFPATPGGTRLGGPGTRGKCAKQTQFSDCGLGPDLAAPPGGADCAKQTQFFWSGGAPGGETCETKPILAARRRSRAGTPDPRRGDYAKQSQTWAGWDVWGAREERANHAKQSQFLDCGFRIADCGLNTESRPDRPAACRLRPAQGGCTNKPNSARLGRGRVPSGRKMRNKAKLGRLRASGGRQARGAYRAEQTQFGPSVPNKANSSTARYGAWVREAARYCGCVRANLSYNRAYGGEAKSYWVPRRQAV